MTVQGLHFSAFIYGILLEVLGKWYSRLPDYAKSQSENCLEAVTDTSDSEHSGNIVWYFFVSVRSMVK